MLEIFIFGFWIGISAIANETQILAILFLYLIFYIAIFRYEFWQKKIELFRENQQKILKLTLSGILGIIFGILFFEIFDAKKEENESNLKSQNYTIEGKIEHLNPKISGQNFFVRDVKIGGKKIEEKILVYAPLFPKFRNEEKIKFSCKIYKPKNFDSFNYKNYLKSYEVSYLCRFPKILETKKEESFYTKIANFKFFFAEKLEKILPEPNLSIILGMTVGIDSDFLPETKENFSKAGLTHILVVSGSNIALVLLVANFLTRKFSKSFSIIISAIFAIFYALVVGLEPPVLRALLMGMILVLANFSGREYFAKRALFVAGFLMTIFNPYFVLYNASFLLSFWATFGIISAENFWQNRDKTLFSETLIYSFFAWIWTMPIIFLMFDRISITGILANLIVIPFVPIITIFGFLLFFVSIFSKLLATIFGFPLFLLTEWILLVVEILGI